MNRAVDTFDDQFAALAGPKPFRWQRRLFERLVKGDVPAALDLPTGLGKTSVIFVWLLALAWQADQGFPLLPRRLVYVVDRRTVVDQATAVALQLRQILTTNSLNVPDVVYRIRGSLGGLCAKPDDDASPLAISTLRGELADNREWQADPARPTIIIGTVDMIGSRLLFSGYGVSRRMRPFHAGLLGQDTMLIHDEAHLSPAFGKLLREIARRQCEGKALRPLQLIELSATQREDIELKRCFSLAPEDREEEEVARRLNAAKALRFESNPTDRKAAQAAMVECALSYADARQRVTIYVRSPKDAQGITAALGQKVGENRVAILTGTIRGNERDKLAEDPLFKGFRTDPHRPPPDETPFLIATSAGEVGIDLDADHMVCDLAPLDSMIQRLGRVNRLGRGGAIVHVIEWPKQGSKGDEEASDATTAATRAALESLPRRDGGFDASPAMLALIAARCEAFSGQPRIVPLTDILLDNWAMTRIDELPGRPLVERWLHGVERAVPELYVAWREEVGQLDLEIDRRQLKTLFDNYPIASRERVRGNFGDVLPELKKIAKRKDKSHAVILPIMGAPEMLPLVQLDEKRALHNATIVLSPDVGGLDHHGMLNGARDAPVPDVADRGWAKRDGLPERRRFLIKEDQETELWTARPLGAIETAIGIAVKAESLSKVIREVKKQQGDYREKARVVLATNSDGEPTKLLLLLSLAKSVTLAQDSTAAAAKSQILTEHLAWTQDAAANLASRLVLKSVSLAIAEAIQIGGWWHDRGKDRPAWQRAIGNPRRGNDWEPLAKSGKRGFDVAACGAYRHEFGSLREASANPAICAHPERDLILHLIAAHHGWSRPHFTPDQWDIAEGVTEEENAAIGAAAMRRFAWLQRRFGHWGLAWLEALMRAADYAATERLADEEATS